MIAALLLAGVAVQDHGHHMMPGMVMPATPKPTARKAVPRKAPARKPAPRPAADSHAVHTMPMPDADAHAGHTMPAEGADPRAGHVMPEGSDPHAGHVMPTDPATAAGTDLPPGDAPAPPAPMPHAADSIWGSAAMARARDTMMRDEGGGQTFAQLLIDMAEVQTGGDYRWEGEGWWGGDIHRFVVKSEGEGRTRKPVGSAEIQALYSRAIGPYFNLQAGVRHDLRPTPSRTFATIGVEGLAPYWFEVDAAAFLSTRGELLARVEGYVDQRLTQRLILQPRAEANFSAQDIRATGTGSGFTAAELGLRLRYEIAREFAPYVGVHWERSFGDTRRFARARGEETGAMGVVVGIRGWF